jgi:transcriptional regulator with XRE-family HTH domain
MPAPTRYGLALRDKRLGCNLSIAKVAKLSGVSRRHVATAENGGNISVAVLRKLMRCLGIRELDIDLDTSLTLSESTVPHELLQAAADDAARGAAFSQRAAATLLSFTPGVGKYVPNDSPVDEAIHEEAARLISDFSNCVRDVRDPHKLASLGAAVRTNLLTLQSQENDSKAKRKRKTA